MSRPTTVVQALPIAGNVTTWVVQVAIHDNDAIAFVQAMDSAGPVRIVLPGKVVAAIIRQEAATRARMTDRRSEARKAQDRERERLTAARTLLERKREERRVRRERGA